MTTVLDAWMNGELVGAWTVDRATHSSFCEASWLRSPKVRSLSLSLPITASREVRGDGVASGFDNLLPDYDRIRERLSRRFKTKRADAFSLLEAIGRDCVGAVQLLPEEMTPAGWHRVGCEPLDEGQVAEIPRAVPADDDGDLRREDRPGRRALRPRVDGQRHLDRAAAAGRLLPGAGLLAEAEVRTATAGPAWRSACGC